MEIFEWRLQLMISVAAETALLPLAAHLLPLATAVCNQDNNISNIHLCTDGRYHFKIDSRPIEGEPPNSDAETDMTSQLD